MRVVGYTETWVVRGQRRRPRHNRKPPEPFDWAPVVIIGGSLGIACAIGGLGGAFVGLLLFVLGAAAYGAK